jgi:AcrR family transcriptional regulator
MPDRQINKLGHRIGARGGRTRAAILEATRRLLDRRHLGEIRVADVAAEAGLSPSNFYTYFKTVEEPVLALCEGVAAEFQPLSRHLEGDWSAEAAFGAARAYVMDVLLIWRDHGPVLRIEQGRGGVRGIPRAAAAAGAPGVRAAHRGGACDGVPCAGAGSPAGVV